MSLSESPAADGPEGFTADHVVDATVYVARALISAGAAIAYGGDFRPTGFTSLLAALIQAYNQTASQSAQSLYSYLAAPISPEDAPDDVPLKIKHLVATPEIAPDALLPAPDRESHPGALYLSDMRRVMAKHTAARVLLGGKTEPRIKEDSAGYSGRYPGIVEEAWRTMEAGKPLYVLGGFGGAAALVAGLLEGHEIPPQLKIKPGRSSSFSPRTRKPSMPTRGGPSSVCRNAWKILRRRSPSWPDDSWRTTPLPSRGTGFRRTRTGHCFGHATRWSWRR